MTQVFTGSGVRAFQLIAVKSAIKLEQLGLRRSSGSVRLRWARHFGMPGRPSHAAVIARIDEELAKLPTTQEMSP